MAKRVLDVGNCGPDHYSISEMIRTQFDAEIDQAHAAADAIPMLSKHSYDLVMVNRLLDRDGSPGMDVIAEVRQQRPNIPVMMITNFSDHQDAAIAAGAVLGFGKNAIGGQQTIELLAQYLG